MFTFSKTVLSPIELLNEALKLYVQSFKKLFVLLLGCFIISLYYASGYFLHAFPIDITKIKHVSSWFLTYYIVVIITSLVVLYLKAVIMHNMQQVGINRGVSLSKSYSFVWHKYWTIFLSQILISGIIVIGLFALVLPAIYAGIALIFAIPIILFNNQTVIGSIKESFILVWGKWWHILTTVALPMVVMLCVDTYLPTFYPKGILMNISGFVLLAISSFAIFPIFISIILVVFNDVSIAKKISKKSSRIHIDN